MAEGREEGPDHRGDPLNAREREQHLREYSILKSQGKPFFPYAVMKDSMMAAITVGVIVIMSILFGAELGPKADPTTTTYTPRPEWYFFFLFELARGQSGPGFVRRSHPRSAWAAPEARSRRKPERNRCGDRSHIAVLALSRLWRTCVLGASPAGKERVGATAQYEEGRRSPPLRVLGAQDGDTATRWST